MLAILCRLIAVFALPLATRDQVYNRAISYGRRIFTPTTSVGSIERVRLLGNPLLYFLTICTQDKKQLLGSVTGEWMMPNAMGNIVSDCWMEIPDHFRHVELAAHVVMPNHLHGIIIIRESYERCRRLFLEMESRSIARPHRWMAKGVPRSSAGHSMLCPYRRKRRVQEHIELLWRCTPDQSPLSYGPSNLRRLNGFGRPYIDHESIFGSADITSK